MHKSFLVLLVLWAATVGLAQTNETEPNDSRSQANPVILVNPTIVSATFRSAGDVDFFSVYWQKDCMYYVTSVENDAGVAPDVQLFVEGSAANLLKVSVTGRNGNNNFRLSGYVATISGRYDVRISNAGTTTGAYKVRFAGGRGAAKLASHEPDNSIAAAGNVSALALADTVYGAVYPANDIDYYKLTGTEGEQYIIGTTPILDQEVRDLDSYIVLYDSNGAEVAKNDDVGPVSTPSGSANCTFSRIKGIFAKSGDYYLAVRSFYNSDAGETINESNPPMGEYGVYCLASEPEPVVVVPRYPHLEMPAATSAQIQWNTATAIPTTLNWGTTPACEEKFYLAEPAFDHRAPLSGLTPGTKYYYRAVLDSETTVTEYFYTAKPASTKEVKFFVIGDSSPYAAFGSSPEQVKVADQIQKKD